jgi:hypothetical protein
MSSSRLAADEHDGIVINLTNSHIFQTARVQSNDYVAFRMLSGFMTSRGRFIAARRIDANCSQLLLYTVAGLLAVIIGCVCGVLKRRLYIDFRFNYDDNKHEILG